MPTIEERLAALETKLAALTDTTPTTYYEHQYSGEEIDESVGVTQDTVPTLVRPNLLDNWYFGNPVDQRGGYVVYAGANLYSDASCTTIVGQVSGGPYAARAISDICVSFTSNATYYCKIGDTGVVRGYTGVFAYTIDRWQLGDGSISLSVVADGIVVKGGNAANTDYIFTRVERLPVGKYTFSVLFADNTANVVLTTRLTDISVVPAVESREASGVLALTWDQPEEFNSDNAYFRIHAPGSVKILAAKLELGPTQTLAHKEGDRLVLNEVPEYGDQLRRCQRYQFEVFDRTFAGQGYLAQVKAIDSTQAYGVLPTPVTMRGDGIPALVTDCSAANPYGAFGIYSTGYSDGMGVITGISLFSKVQNGVILRAVGSNFVAGNDYQIWVDNQNAHQFLLNYNL